ncbi:MAG: bifunctional demethylmenaquinone methyltransferase/2-methoxy-6-polyprenyl-1,4-benzoquinol methylase UbiE [Pseudobdellovibrionaceae bacterium]
MTAFEPSKYQGPEAEKIRSMFDQVAPGYDKANSILSLGIHHLWKQKLVRWSQARPGQKVLDCATGTGDLALAFKQVVGPTGQVIGSDFSAEMLKTAPQKALEKNLQIQFEIADAINLPYESQTFDIVSISFGIRNVSDPVKALAEMHRVLKPKGTLMVLEFGQMKTPVLSKLYNFYSRRILPQIGGWITGKKEAYNYLQTSSAQFPDEKDFQKLLTQAGFLSSEYKTLSFGIAYLYKAHKS